MSILKKVSDVLKEVFWIKTSSKKKSSRSKVTTKKSVKKKIKKVSIVKVVKPDKPLKIKKPLKTAKPLKVPAAGKSSKSQLDPKLVKTGEITHFFDRINVCVVKITHGTVLIGDKLTIAGLKTKLVQKVWSMQIESEDVKIAKKGQLIGLKVDKPVTVGDVVYK